MGPLQISLLKYHHLYLSRIKSKIHLIKLHQASHQVFLPVLPQILRSKLFNLLVQDKGDEVMRPMIKNHKRKMTILLSLRTATKTPTLILKIAEESLIHRPKSKILKIIVINQDQTSRNSPKFYNRVKLTNNVSLLSV